MLKKLSRYLPSLSECWILFFLLILGQFLAGLLVMKIPVFTVPEGTAVTKFGVFLTYVLGFVPLFLYVFLKTASRLRKCPDLPSVPLDALRKGEMSLLIYWPLMIITLFAFILVTDAVPLPQAPEWFEKMMEEMTDADGLGWTLLTVGVAAPLLEELVFRGLFLRGLLTRVSPMTAIIWSAVFFGMVHLNPWQAIPALFFGIFFGWIYYKTGSLWTTIVFHSINNSFSVLLSRMTENTVNVDNLGDLMGNGIAYWTVLLAALFILVEAIVLIQKKFNS